jgi:hypothetical protein
LGRAEPPLAHDELKSASSAAHDNGLKDPGLAHGGGKLL